MSIPEQYLDQAVGKLGFRVLGLDLDGVCGDYVAALRAFCMEQMGLPAERFPDPTSYNLAKAGWPFSDTADYLSWHRKAVQAGIYRTIPAMPGLADALHDLDKADVHIRIVSHRLIMGGLHKKVVSDTAEWLEEHRIPYMSLCFTGLKDSISATLHIEDAPVMVDSLRGAEEKVLIFDQPYNRHISGPRMTDWETAVPTILDLMGNSN